jgi:hypothetical protein
MIEIPALPYSLARLALQSRAVFKRLGFFAEGRDNIAALIELCRARLTAGNAKLDPALDCKRLISRWRLLIPPTWAPGGIDWSTSAKSSTLPSRHPSTRMYGFG